MFSLANMDPRFRGDDGFRDDGFRDDGFRDDGSGDDGSGEWMTASGDDGVDGCRPYKQLPVSFSLPPPFSLHSCLVLSSANALSKYVRFAVPSMMGSFVE